MPKLNNRPPKYSQLNGYAVVYVQGKPKYLGGLYNSPESLIAYSHFVAELQTNSAALIPVGEKDKVATIRELNAAFLDYAKENMTPVNYSFYRVIILDFISKLYDTTLVNEFSPRSLKLVRAEMIKSRRFSRKVVNRCVKGVIYIFGWGVENEIVQESTWNTLKAVKSLQEGHHGTFENKEREPVPDEVVRRTLPSMPPTLRAMVQLQRILGMRPSEIFNMRVGDIDTTRGNGLWYYVPGSYKTSRFVGKITFPLGIPEQELITPYLEGKRPENAVFSPRTAMAERNTEKRANRKTKVSPSQEARDKERSQKPSRWNEFYNRDSYRQAIQHAIDKGNRTLSDDEKIPRWYPYALRHTAATIVETEVGLDQASALLGHRTPQITRRYSKAQLSVRESLARNRRNPFEVEES